MSDLLGLLGSTLLFGVAIPFAVSIGAYLFFRKGPLKPAFEYNSEFSSKAVRLLLMGSCLAAAFLMSLLVTESPYVAAIPVVIIYVAVAWEMRI